MTKIEKDDMVEVAKGYIKQRGYKYSDDVVKKISDMLMGMEAGNLDRMIAAIDEALIKCDKREKAANSEKKTVMPEDF